MGNIMYIKILVFSACISLIYSFLPLNTKITSELKKILIIQDEKPQMEVLAQFLRAKGNIDITIVSQDSLPVDFSIYRAVIGYIHGRMTEKTELAIIEYTQNGGRYICLHHSISSGKAQNRYYFDFLGIRLDSPGQSSQPVDPGEGYGWTHGGDNGVTLTVVNLNKNHYITNHNIVWGEEIDYTSSDYPSSPGKFPVLLFEKSEIYMNHKFTDGREKTVLCGFKFFDERNQKLFMQDRAVWYKKYEMGEIIYFKMGHSIVEFENINFSQMILNAINWET
jgi:hypothetical protein